MSMTTTRADMTRAVLEGVAYSLRDILEIVRNLGAKVNSARIIGGGAKSALWCQIIADVLNVRVERINAAEGPAFGAAILAMVGAGVYKTVEEACGKLISVTETFRPDPEAAARFDSGYAVFTSLYKAMENLFPVMAERSATA
jgi:xylulokinase